MKRRSFFQLLAGVPAALAVAKSAAAAPSSSDLWWSVAITYRRSLTEHCDVAPTICHLPWRPVSTPIVVKGWQLLGHPASGTLLWYRYQLAHADGTVLFTSSFNDSAAGRFDADWTFTFQPPTIAFA